jgi:hypothetical protein
MVIDSKLQFEWRAADRGFNPTGSAVQLAGLGTASCSPSFKRADV